MLQQMLLETAFGKAIIILSILGILSRMITILSYKRMKNAAENPNKTKKQWVLLLKKRYESYERFGRMKNVEAFVEHYFSRKGIMGIPLSMWDKSGLFIAGAAGLIALLAAAVSYNQGTEMRGIVGWLLVGAVSFAGLMLLHIISDSTNTKRQILAALTDYLANGSGLRNRAASDDGMEKFPTKEEARALAEAAVTEEERQVLEEVFEDYFSFSDE